MSDFTFSTEEHCVFSLSFIDALNILPASCVKLILCLNYVSSWSVHLLFARFLVHYSAHLCVCLSVCLCIQSWVERAGRKTLLTDTLDLSELFHPDTFLNALRQETAR